MSVYLVTWDLNHQKPNYAQARESLIGHLSQYEHIRDSGLDSVWFISSTGSADTLVASIRNQMDENDKIIATKLAGGQHQGWLNTEIWNWINARL